MLSALVHWPVRGSQISLSPSPATLTAKTVTAIATPGQNDIHGAWVRYCWAAFNIDPHDGVGGCVPSPRKLRVASVMIAPATFSDPWTTIGARLLGSR